MSPMWRWASPESTSSSARHRGDVAGGAAASAACEPDDGLLVGVLCERRLAGAGRERDCPVGIEERLARRARGGRRSDGGVDGSAASASTTRAWRRARSLSVTLAYTASRISW